jgi:hypothetical protein
MEPRNITGEKFGVWTIIDDSGKRKHGRDIVTCQCRCGTIRIMAKYFFIKTNPPDKCSKCARKIHKMFSIFPRVLE